MIAALGKLTVRHVAAAAFAVVAAVAGVISYSHVRHVAGENWQASLLPLSIDGLLVAGSLALWLERREGGAGSRLAWASVVLGLAASLLANLASSKPAWIPPEWVAPAVAVWPAIALALAFELVVRVRRSDSGTHGALAVPGDVPTEPPVVLGPPNEAEPERAAEPEPAPAPPSRKTRARPSTTAADVQAAGEWAAAERRNGRKTGRGRIAAERGLSPHHSRTAAAVADQLLAHPVKLVAER